ncbi:phage tail assembly chaperone [Caulobacter sp. UNC279MFTsu5.1]|uniref:phage tail assembly chaperone n=1 Tax=Caulobacter sp. UNC279MFTsu5.1 TaxID=1502775 RepID=UPI0008EC1D30|nr:phage tail assembly chaperone [Caulobacter sp. UNC279MFTsu5.1]SFK41407.1 Phage tail assembly chaperone protein [Caulobacter sp. UNC279MFTsu5.1]
MRQVVAFYDHETGEITAITQGLPGSIIAHRRPYVVLPEFRSDWDLTHVVIDDQLVERGSADMASMALTRAMAALRARRDGLLRNEFDPIRSNPERWDPLSSEQKAALLAYRQALRDWPDTEAEPLNPTPPSPPAL